MDGSCLVVGIETAINARGRGFLKVGSGLDTCRGLVNAGSGLETGAGPDTGLTGAFLSTQFCADNSLLTVTLLYDAAPPVVTALSHEVDE